MSPISNIQSMLVLRRSAPKQLGHMPWTGTKGPAIGYHPAQRATWTVCLELLRSYTRRDPHLMGSMPLSCPKEISRFVASIRSQQRVLGITWTMCVELLRICTRRDPRLRGLIMPKRALPMQDFWCRPPYVSDLQFVKIRSLGVRNSHVLLLEAAEVPC